MLLLIFEIHFLAVANTTIQIHLMLLLIKIMSNLGGFFYVIQIHLMLLLIPLKINYLCFNNIKKILKYQASF